MRLRGSYRFQAFHFDFPALGVVPKQGGILLFEFCFQRCRLVERDFQRTILAAEPQIGEAAADFQIFLRKPLAHKLPDGLTA